MLIVQKRKLKLKGVDLLRTTWLPSYQKEDRTQAIGHQSVLRDPTLAPDGARLVKDAGEFQVVSVTVAPENEPSSPPRWEVRATGGSHLLPGPRSHSHSHSHSHFQPFIGALSAPNKYNTLNPELRESCTLGGAPHNPSWAK